MIDRFGSLPGEVDNLLKVVGIKQMCRTARIEKVDAGPKGAVVNFRDNEFPNPVGLVQWIAAQVGTAIMKPDRLVLKRGWDSGADRLEGTRRLVSELSKIAIAQD